MVTEAQHVAQTAGILGPLGIDAKLFAAQLVNFGIVAFVLWRWGYKPLLALMDEREKKIAQGLKDAEASSVARSAAETEAADIIADARHKAKAIIDEAEAEAERERQRGAQRAREDADTVVAQARAQLASDRAKLVADVKAEAGTLVALAAERVLKSKLDGKRDAELIAAAIRDVERAI